MDPNANLQEQESILNAANTSSGISGIDNHDRARLRELREALDTWLYGGGFAPDWSKAPKASVYFLDI